MSELEKLRAEVKILRAEKEHAEMDVAFFKKIRGDRKGQGLNRIRNEHAYLAIKELHEETKFSICSLCKIGHVSRAAYYKWLNHKESDNDKLNQKLAERLEELHKQHPDMGYRRLNDKLYHDDKIDVKRQTYLTNLSQKADKIHFETSL